MKLFICLILLLFLATPWAVAQVHLKGIVTNDGCNNGFRQKDCKVFPHVRISVGTMSDVTDANGRFAIALPVQYTPGSEVIAQVDIPDHVIHMPLYGKFNLPNTLLDDVFEQQIIILPKGSPKLFTNASIIAFIENISKRESGKTKLEKVKSLNNYAAYFKEFSDFHGFTPGEVKELIDAWANTDSVKNDIDNFRLQGARHYYSKNFQQAAANYEKAGDLAVENSRSEQKKTQKQVKRAIDAIEDEYNNYKLAGNSAWAAYDFKGAIRNFQKAERAVTLPDSSMKLHGSFAISKWEVRELLAGAYYEEGIRTNGSEGNALLIKAAAVFRAAITPANKINVPYYWAVMQGNLGGVLKEQAMRSAGSNAQDLFKQSIAAYQASMEVHTRKDWPFAWAMAQDNLGLVLKELAERTPGNDGKILLAQSVTAHRAALEVFTQKELPQYWAHTHTNLGAAILAQAERSEGNEAAALYTG